jgi:hypothetical protein
MVSSMFIVNLAKEQLLKFIYPRYSTKIDKVSEPEATHNSDGVETIQIVEDEPTLLQMTSKLTSYDSIVS